MRRDRDTAALREIAALLRDRALGELAAARAEIGRLERALGMLPSGGHRGAGAPDTDGDPATFALRNRAEAAWRRDAETRRRQVLQQLAAGAAREEEARARVRRALVRFEVVRGLARR